MLNAARPLLDVQRGPHSSSCTDHFFYQTLNNFFIMILLQKQFAVGRVSNFSFAF